MAKPPRSLHNPQKSSDCTNHQPANPRKAMSQISRVEVHVFQFDAPNLGQVGGQGVGALGFLRGAKTRLTKYAVAIMTSNGLRGEYVTHWVASGSALGQTLMLAPYLIGRQAEEREEIYD